MAKRNVSAEVQAFAKLHEANLEKHNAPLRKSADTRPQPGTKQTMPVHAPNSTAVAKGATRGPSGHVGPQK